MNYSQPPVARSAAEERAFKVERERAVGHTAVRGMLKSASKGALCCDGDDAHLTRCANVTAPLTPGAAPRGAPALLRRV